MIGLGSMDHESELSGLFLSARLDIVFERLFDNACCFLSVRFSHLSSRFFSVTLAFSSFNSFVSSCRSEVDGSFRLLAFAFLAVRFRITVRFASLPTGDWLFQ